MTFTDEEKIMVFDKIAALYFDRNFGTMTKADFETFLFSEYIEHCLRERLTYDDYSMSKELGITQSRVRALKERKELRYPYKDFQWKEAFAEAVKNVKYDEHDHYVKIMIQDVNVMNEVRYFIESKGWFDEYSLNKKMLRISLECFIEVCLQDESISELFSEETKKKVKAVSASENEIKDFLEDFTKDGLKSFVMSASRETLGAVLGILPFGGFAKTAIGVLSKVIKGA